MKTNPLKEAGESDLDPKAALLESAPESDRWNPLPGSAGTKAAVAPSVDEDEEGRSDNELLVEGGIAKAEHEQISRAAKAAAEKEE